MNDLTNFNEIFWKDVIHENIKSQGSILSLENTFLEKAQGGESNCFFRDNLVGRFIKDGSNALCAPIAKICNLSIKLTFFPDKYKVAKTRLSIYTWKI